MNIILVNQSVADQRLYMIACFYFVLVFFLLVLVLSSKTKLPSSDVIHVSLRKLLYLSGETKTTSNCQLVARVWEYLHCLNVSLKLFISQLTSGKRAWRGQMSEAAQGCNYVHLVAPFCVTCVIVNDCVPALFFFFF